VDVRVGPDVIVIHLDDEVLVCGRDARMSRDDAHGFFVADTRIVSGYRLRLGGAAPTLRNSSAVSSYGARFEFTNPSLRTPEGRLDADSLHLRLERSIGGGLHEDYDIVNYADHAIEVRLEISLECEFGDIFEVKDDTVVHRGTMQSDWDESRFELTTTYRHDEFVRALITRVDRCDSPPEYVNGALSFPVSLDAGARWHTCLLWEVRGDDLAEQSPFQACHTLADGDHPTDASRRAWIERAARFSTTSSTPCAVIEQAIADLAGLRLYQHDRLAMSGNLPDAIADELWVPAAGVPWFTALFGRDSLIVALQTQALTPMFPVGALFALGALQADGTDDARDMQPGKILHELRRGELARFHLIPHTPYYGSHDATSLYVWTAAQTWRWHGNRSVLDTLRPHVERALSWIDTDGDIDDDGLQEYASRAPSGGYYNQGWKDSGDAIVDEHGKIATLPLALCELQGYVIAAKRSWADVLDDVWGEHQAATRLRDEAERLADLVESKFWWEEEGTYYLGLDGDKQPLRSVASNAGHLLWAGAVEPERALRTARRLLEPDMWSGWGIRTLSARHPSYNPFSYHRGSVWPHDNAIAAAGMRRYGFDDGSNQIAAGIFDAAARFEDRRPPELFAGLDRDPNGFPVQYLGANVPQAWASGAIVHLVSTMLGLEPDAARGRLGVSPSLPDWLPDLTVENLDIGAAEVDIRVSKTADDVHSLTTTPRRGNLAVDLSHDRQRVPPTGGHAVTSPEGW
jgi:glycogen debranching enzyme